MDEAGLRGPKVLLVEDDLDNLAALRETLEAEGIRVVGQASDGASGIELAERLAPDVVLMDLRVPGIDGFEATRAIRAARPDTKVVIFTAYEAVITQSAESVGAFAYLVKGCSPKLMRTSDRSGLASRGRGAAGGSSGSGRVLDGTRRRPAEDRPLKEGGPGCGDLDDARGARAGRGGARDCPHAASSRPAPDGASGHWSVILPIADSGRGSLKLVVRVRDGSIHVVSREA